MNKSNQEPLALSEQQSSRLMQLFQSSFAASLALASSTVGNTPLIWYPALTDIHEQVVHSLSPVLVEHRPGFEGLSPTLSLTLLAPLKGQPTHRIGAAHSPEVTDAFTLPLKPTL